MNNYCIKAIYVKLECSFTVNVRINFFDFYVGLGKSDWKLRNLSFNPDPISLSYRKSPLNDSMIFIIISVKVESGKKVSPSNLKKMPFMKKTSYSVKMRVNLLRGTF